MDTPDMPAASPDVRPPNRYFVVFFQRSEYLYRRTVKSLQRNLDRIITTPAKDNEIDVWIESQGGDAHAAYKLVLDLRSRCRSLRAVVPDYAKSAATLMAVGMDKIFMAAAAELGPLDVQIEHPDREGVIVSALDVADSLEFLSTTAVQLIMRGGASLIDYTGLRRMDAVTVASNFAAQFLQPTISKLDPHVLHQAASQLKIAERYAIQMMAARKNLPDLSIEDGQALMKQLVSDYPAHEFVISRAEAKKLGLPIENAEGYSRWTSVQFMHQAVADRNRSLIMVLSEPMLDEIMNATDSAEEVDGSETNANANGVQDDGDQGAEPAALAAVLRSQTQ